ncbi:MAG: RNA polymerase factor sigma-54 [Alphaproteobacteria bacterium]
MAITQRLDLRQSQSLVMTPQLQQAIKLLQLSNVELTAVVEDELARNPLLERSEGEAPVPGEGDGGEPAAEREDGSGFEAPADPDSRQLAAAETLPGESDAPLDMQHEDVWIDDGPGDAAAGGGAVDVLGAYSTVGPSGSGRSDFADEEGRLEGSLVRPTTLREHLVEQLNLAIANSGDRLIGLHLIDAIDPTGWLTGDLADTAAALGCPVPRVEAVLAVLRRFDPSGVFARDLRDCLALQLADRNRLDPAMQALLDNLPLLARQDKAGLMACCGVDAEDLAEMVQEIRALNPKPGSAFDHEIVETVVPDILMRAHPEGGWVVELNPDTLPRVLVNNDYYARIAKTLRSKAEKDYVTERLQSANWLVKSLDQRANTILKVAAELVRQQDGFFERGVSHLRPLILRDIADAIDMHESTVSRVTTNKYIATPRGVFELKYFFTAAIASSVGGEAHSAESVRYRIKNLIDEEPAGSILSDDRIVEILKGGGIDIARRTVAKYREAMKIPSSVERRRQKARSL